MKTHVLLALVGLATGFITPAFTQTTPKELVGTWTIVAITLEKDGKKTDLFGPNPQGRRIIDADGHVFYISTRGDLPKFASNNRAAGTPEENKAVVQGSIAYFGTLTANEADKTYTYHIEVCTFPNWIGVERKSSYTINGDELISTTSGSSVGEGTVRVVYKRAEAASSKKAPPTVGTWTIVAITLEKDGKKTDLFGPNPQGRLIRDADGHVAYMVTRADLPKFTSNNRAAGTPEENKAVVQGSISYFGTVTTNEAEKTSITHIEVCTYPNWIGVERKTSYTIDGDELITLGSGSSAGEGTVRVVYNRAK